MLSSFAFAGAGLTYHGRILKPDGSPVISPTTQFRVQIRTPGANNCLMYEETQTRDLSSSSGVFVINIGDGSVTPSFQIGNLIQIFDNSVPFAFGAPSGCTITPSYNPTTGDSRNLQVYFREAITMPWESMPMTTINFVPMALHAVKAETANKVGVHSPSSLLRVETPSGDGSPAAALTPAYF
ncbi:MAG: hypothetical protein V4736_08260, partial [Bdellovibrionota bacterium]